jgi:hypothetical protein
MQMAAQLGTDLFTFIFLLFRRLLFQWRYIPLRTFVYLIDFPQSPLIFDLSFQFVILNLLILVY